jgi:hypothetical protein
MAEPVLQQPIMIRDRLGERLAQLAEVEHS